MREATRQSLGGRCRHWNGADQQGARVARAREARRGDLDLHRCDQAAAQRSSIQSARHRLLRPAAVGRGNLRFRQSHQPRKTNNGEYRNNRADAIQIRATERRAH